jgi:glycosyltransferase involved in cell wall biosynthesis
MTHKILEIDSRKMCVGIPVYNEEKYLEGLLRSLIRQSCDDILFVISDNASSDLSFEIMNDICSGDPRFFIFRQSENIGAFCNFRFVFENTTSKYFMWIGGHDYISDGLLEKSVRHLDEFQDISMVAGYPHGFVGDGEPQIMLDAIYKFSDRRLERYLQSIKTIKNCTPFHSLFRRKYLDDFEFRPTRGFDRVCLSRLLWHGGVYYINGERYCRRYFESTRDSNYAQRILGSDDVLTMYDMVVYYLDDLRNLYSGDPRILNFLEHEVIGALSDRYSIQSLYLPDDKIYWKNRVPWSQKHGV